jgi:hypothetical protein
MLDALNFIIAATTLVGVALTSQMFYPVFVVTRRFFQARKEAQIGRLCKRPIYYSREPTLTWNIPTNLPLCRMHNAKSKEL